MAVLRLKGFILVVSGNTIKSLGLAAAAGMALLSFGPQAAQARETASFLYQYPAGVIVIKHSERKLYLTLGDGRAIRYPVAIGKSGNAWRGQAHIQGKYVRPDWSPPAVVKAAVPSLPNLIPGGSPRNPMGERALTLDRSEIAIHGTTQAMRRSIGTAASFGCIRMLNEDVVDLYDRVSVGTPVVAIP